jgi:hypothetical protein
MILQQAMTNDELSPHTPSALPADADATVTGTDIICLAARPTGAGLPKRKFAAQWLRDCLQPGSQTQRSIENSISAFVAPKTEDQVPGGGLCTLRRISKLRSTRQDAQINYLSTLSIFMKQTTYLATLPNPNLKASECHCFWTLKGQH